MKIDKSFKRVLLGLALLGLSHQALAHKLNLFAYAEGDTVSVEGYFADGKKAQSSSVKVMDGSGKVLLEGLTNSEGQYSFKAPQKSDLKIVLNAGMGHQAEFDLSASDLGDGDVAPGRSAASSNAEVAQGTESTTVNPVTNSELEVVVHRAVNEAIKPLVRELDESRKKISISELVGTVGYIFGVLGLFAYYRARQMVDKKSTAKKTEQG